MGSNKTTGIFLAVLTAGIASVILVGSGISSADKGGCPNANAANGAANANENSAHVKKGETCSGFVPATPTPEPTPSPEPTPPPPPSTDTKVAAVSVGAPGAVTAGVEFMVSATASLHNNGPAESINVDTTFSLVLPAGCTAPFNNLTITVPNKSLPASVVVMMTRNWRVICSTPGPVQFNVGVTTAITAGQPWAEANPANNSGAGTANSVVN